MPFLPNTNFVFEIENREQHFNNADQFCTAWRGFCWCCSNRRPQVSGIWINCFCRSLVPTYFTQWIQHAESTYELFRKPFIFKSGKLQAIYIHEYSSNYHALRTCWNDIITCQQDTTGCCHWQFTFSINVK